MRIVSFLAASGLALVLTACPKDKAANEELTLGEASQALTESTASSQAQALTAASVDITTSFTIGDGAQKAAENIRDFISSQMPCANTTVDLAEAKVTVEYGAKLGNCVYKGNTFKGTHSIKVAKIEGKRVVIEHTWTKFTNSKVTVDGTASATWDFGDVVRTVDHNLTWSRLDGLTGKDTGTMTQKPIGGTLEGLKEGIVYDGSRAWEGKSGRWDLSVQGVTARWEDPIPEAGTYKLASPKNKVLTLSFKRVDSDTIAATLTNGSKSFTFNVNKAGGSKEQS